MIPPEHFRAVVAAIKARSRTDLKNPWFDRIDFNAVRQPSGRTETVLVWVEEAGFAKNWRKLCREALGDGPKSTFSFELMSGRVLVDFFGHFCAA